MWVVRCGLRDVDRRKIMKAGSYIGEKKAMESAKSFKDLVAWKKARELVASIYELTTLFPREEVNGLSSQMRRCAVSVPSNIAEGIGRKYKKETIQFLHIARGSLYELETQLYIASDLGFFAEAKVGVQFQLIEECRKMLNGLIRYYENSQSLT